MARTYKRDSRGRFAGGGGGSSRPAAKPAPRGRNRLTRDNSGRITSQGGDGATARGGRLRTASGKQRAVQTARIKGGGGELRSGKGGGKREASKPALTPSQIQGARRRASERPEALLGRAQGRANRQLRELQGRKSSLETALRRRRGKLDEAGKRAVAKDLSKTNRRIEKVKQAQAQYRQDIGVANMNRGMMMNYRTGKKSPQNERTARNRLSTLRKRVSFLRKDETKSTDKWGGEYDGPKLKAAKKALTAQAASGMRGLRVSIRTKSQATRAQSKRRNAVIKQANATKWTGQGGKVGLYTKRVRRGIARQGNLLTGGIDRVGRRFRPVRRR